MQVNEIQPLRYLDQVSTLGVKSCGITPKRIYRDGTNMDFLGDCIERFTYCITDLNWELEALKADNYSRQDYTYIIMLVTWIREAFLCIRNSVKPSIMKMIGPDEQVKCADQFIQAVRSFVVAHPLNTDHHPAFGLDGNYICVDICDVRNNAMFQALHSAIKFQSLSFNGLTECKDVNEEDFCLVVYSQKDDGMRFKQYIACSFSDFYKVAKVYIDRMYAIDLALRRYARSHRI